MFKAYHMKTGKIHTVYAVCGIMFLLYDGTAWHYDYMENYEPVED